MTKHRYTDTIYALKIMRKDLIIRHGQQSRPPPCLSPPFAGAREERAQRDEEPAPLVHCGVQGVLPRQALAVRAAGDGARGGALQVPRSEGAPPRVQRALLRRAGDPGAGAPALAGRDLPRPEAGEPAHRPRRIPQDGGLWVRQEGGQRQDVHDLRHA
eukprot:1181784-Prorocentrum_minimum.AAC.4